MIFAFSKVNKTYNHFIEIVQMFGKFIFLWVQPKPPLILFIFYFIYSSPYLSLI